MISSGRVVLVVFSLVHCCTAEPIKDECVDGTCMGLSATASTMLQLQSSKNKQVPNVEQQLEWSECQGEDDNSWEAGYGGCATYARGRYNEQYCGSDSSRGYTANQACPQCGECQFPDYTGSGIGSGYGTGADGDICDWSDPVNKSGGNCGYCPGLPGATWQEFGRRVETVPGDKMRCWCCWEGQDQSYIERSLVADQGNDIGNLTGTFLDACKAACTADDRCNSFTHPDSGDCYFKDKIVTASSPSNSSSDIRDIRTYYKSEAPFEQQPEAPSRHIPSDLVDSVKANYTLESVQELVETIKGMDELELEYAAEDV